MGAPIKRYHLLAIALHWVMAIAFILMLASGLSMEYAPLEKSQKFQLFQWHKSLGVLLLCAFVVRLLVRFITHHPALPVAMKPFEKRAATAGHWILYVWMFAVPFSGWAMVSASDFGLPTIVFGWFEWPHIPNIAGNELIQSSSHAAHKWLAYSFILLIAGHVAAVIKHAVIDHENLLPRMGIGRAKKDSQP